MLLFMLCFIGAFIRTLTTARRLAFLQGLLAGLGLFFAGRQLWIQSLPSEQVPACMPGLDVLIRYFPLQDVLRALLWGTGECGEVAWHWLGLSMPAWSALFFAAFLLTAFWIGLLLYQKIHYLRKQ
jgi:disulfide bond formation protein DsbB